ncbi:translation initiation factor eIF-2B subunit alpha isoform X2 [Contarinia nasturtii]|uniref:translation initiation factor eIF-2B subunit alpha isoform X2 n=1 Tax=Contarinia nasturtii TaxID=265458 RepID=UPI0012D48CAC|nr:translation initiation factor eIF-2B subunit alpha isoform X2 [Contarinia nasturtii]
MGKQDKKKLKPIDKSNAVENFPVEKYFSELLNEDKSLSAGIAAIKTLLAVLKKTKFDTVQELHSTIQTTVKTMRTSDHPITAIVSASELFSRFITLAAFDDKTADECKALMLHRGEIFLKKLLEARNIIAKQCAQFVTDGCRVLTHARSRAVLETLILAAKSNKRFHVYVTRSSPDNTGEQMCNELKTAGIECTLILDAAIGYIMESIDIVLVGAEGVVESGGIINRVGTYTMALCAREMKKPFYVLAESLKFSRLYPLNQRDLPNDYKFSKQSLTENLTQAHPLVDYTSPAYITLLFTDIGILTPSAVSDELIKLYL